MSNTEIIFTIENLGSSDLELIGDPIVSVSGENADEFLTEQPADNFIPAGRNAVFKLTFSPLTIGEKTATISIENNDFNENPYTFTVIGKTKPEPDFSARLRYGCKPLLVSFEDRSSPTGDITSWAWDFDGDGIVDDTSQNPIHKYTKDLGLTE